MALFSQSPYDYDNMEKTRVWSKILSLYVRRAKFEQKKEGVGKGEVVNKDIDKTAHFKLTGNNQLNSNLANMLTNRGYVMTESSTQKKPGKPCK